MNAKNRTFPWLVGLAVIALAAAALLGAPGYVFAEKTSAEASDGTVAEADWLNGKFAGTKEEVEELMGHYRAIELSAGQEELRQEALGPLPAACCNKFSAATCCCECNLSRSLWGLSKYLIVEEQASAKQVRNAAVSWFATLNPDGYEGNTCMTGRCNLPFKEGGCGGMAEGHLSY